VAWSRGIPAKECGGGSVSRGGRRGNRRGKGVWIGFIVAHCFVEEGERRGGHGIGLKTADGAGGALGCVVAARLRRPDVARRGEDSGGGVAVGGGVGRRVEERRRAAGAWEAAGGGGSCARAEAEEIGDSRKTMEDSVAKSRKYRDLTVKHK
jgi:hypothetical protein